MKAPSRKAVIDKFLEGFERLDPLPRTIELRSPGALAPTTIEITPNEGGEGHNIDVWFPMGAEEPSLETAARVLGAKSETLAEVNASKRALAEKWHECAITIALFVHQDEPGLAVKALADILYDSTKPDTFCKICPKKWETTYAFLRQARKDGLIPLQNEPIEVWRRRMGLSQ
jgi:hypothetical protein